MDTVSQQVSKPKHQETVSVPADLLDFLKEVHHLFFHEDDAAMWESDDLLQSECAYGGLVRQDGTQYGLTYFPDIDKQQDAEKPPAWELLLDKSEIESIAVGRQTQIALWACQVAECGNKFTDPTVKCFPHDYVDAE